MLKWIKKRTRRTSAPSGGDPSCLSVVKDNDSIFSEDQGFKDEQPLNNQVCPLCRAIKSTDHSADGCLCGQVNLDSSDIIDYDTIKRQTRRVNSVHIKNKLKETLMPTSYLICKTSPLCRSRSDVTGLKYTPIKSEVPKRLSPRSRIPILNPEEFAELSSEDESSGYGDSECSGASQSGYSSDDSLRNLLQNMVINPKSMEPASPISPCASPVPKMGCRAMIQRSSSSNERKNFHRKIAIRSHSLNRAARPSCGVKRSKSRAASFRTERRPELSLLAQQNTIDNKDLGSGYLDIHIDQLAQIRTELQNLYSLDKNM
ncbi:hypothetical protein LOTGIDRAFT_228690 [Lottia gigantea]|uniref:Uncharacterized protein n=1 Tax=Lottia gigantea TaxID=225164 RepID=V4AFX4_LOTGI|nr:hypothetical protein LOTGIDRAFT_228690 [Lottia gigantea]ESO94050.1 hypothetical protein LOTGIDRAFT_228690 [Lottia gigantea]